MERRNHESRVESSWIAKMHVAQSARAGDSTMNQLTHIYRVVQLDSTLYS